MTAIVRIFSLISYLLIFLQGSMILVPLGSFLVTGIFTAEPLMKILIILADISLLFLIIIPFNKRTKWTSLWELIAFFGLLLPLLKILMSFSFGWFNYFLFLFPVGCFIVFFPLSIYLAHRDFNRNRKNLITK